jgi:hypothetical protein
MLKKIIKNVLNGQETKKLDSLFKQPKAEKKEDMPQFQVFKSNLIQQADLLFITHDRGYKYILVVVDDHSKKMDAEKLKDKDSEYVFKAFKNIYERGILHMPKEIELDAGKEFKGDVKKYFDDHNVRIRYALPNRHRQQGLVERKNQILGTLIHQLQVHKELRTGKINREWVAVLPRLVKEINQNLPKPIHEAISEDPISNKYNERLLNIGDKVRIQLDHPIDTQGKRLIGEFRSTDIRWTPKIHTITQVLIKPGFPPMYLTDKTNEVSYTKEQLQKVNEAHFV